MSGDSSRVATISSRAPQSRDLTRCQFDRAPFLHFADAKPVLIDHLAERAASGGFGFGEGAASGCQGCADLDGEFFELGFAFTSQADAFGVGLLDRLSGGDLVRIAGHQKTPFLFGLPVIRTKTTRRVLVDVADADDRREVPRPTRGVTRHSKPDTPLALPE